jgi:hypothetical protein
MSVPNATFVARSRYCNKECDNAACRAAQKKWIAGGSITQLPWEPPEQSAVKAEVKHDDNDWGISCDDGGNDDGDGAASADLEMASQLAEGVYLQYTRKAEVRREHLHLLRPYRRQLCSHRWG